MQTQNDGCYLGNSPIVPQVLTIMIASECIVLTTSNKFIGEVVYLTESKPIPHYLTGRTCRDADHVSPFSGLQDNETRICKQVCNRGECIDRSAPVPESGNLTITIVRAVLGMNQVDEDKTLPDPYVEIRVGNHSAVTKTCNETRDAYFDETFTFGTVSSVTPIQLSVHESDETFDDIIDFIDVTPVDVVRKGWNNEKNYYKLSDSVSIQAKISFN